MTCTCRNPGRCPICNTTVRVPLTNLEGAAGAAILVDKFARRDSSSSREELRGEGLRAEQLAEAVVIDPAPHLVRGDDELVVPGHRTGALTLPGP